MSLIEIKVESKQNKVDTILSRIRGEDVNV